MTRLDPGELNRATLARPLLLVRTHLMRRTVHLLTADDALAWHTRHDAMPRGRVLGVYRLDLDGVDLDELVAAAAGLLADGDRRHRCPSPCQRSARRVIDSEARLAT
ncbi:MAG: crosslink repair DNA glycosylase YcaQ family protein [Pseudonocardia sp.]